jgi:nucleotide-binding universal stress UspA family protein
MFAGMGTPICVLQPDDELKDTVQLAGVAVVDAYRRNTSGTNHPIKKGGRSIALGVAVELSDMYRALLPINENESRARAQVEAVVDLPVATGDLAVDILHVHEGESTTDPQWAAGEGFAESFDEEMAETVRSSDRLPSAVETAVDLLKPSDCEFTVHERGGEPAVAILEFASEHDSNTIILGVSGRSPVGKVLFGSVAQAVILDSDRPVMVVPAHTAES